MQFNRDVFFGLYRDKYGALNQAQVDGLNFLLDSFEQQKAYDLSTPQIAYMLATAKHETGDTFQPIYERGSRAYFNQYEPPSRKAKRLGNIIKGDGYKYRGRGYVQITGRANYERLGDIIGLDLIDNPDLALEPAIAADIMLEGFMRGLFTGKKLTDYIADGSTDFTYARRCINGLDRAKEIAVYAVQFESVLHSSGILKDGSELSVF